MLVVVIEPDSMKAVMERPPAFLYILIYVVRDKPGEPAKGVSVPCGHVEAEDIQVHVICLRYADFLGSLGLRVRYSHHCLRFRVDDPNLVY